MSHSAPESSACREALGREHPELRAPMGQFLVSELILELAWLCCRLEHMRWPWRESHGASGLYKRFPSEFYPMLPFVLESFSPLSPQGLFDSRGNPWCEHLSTGEQSLHPQET